MSNWGAHLISFPIETHKAKQKIAENFHSKKQRIWKAFLKEFHQSEVKSKKMFTSPLFCAAASLVYLWSNSANTPYIGSLITQN